MSALSPFGGETFKGYKCEHCLARFVYGDSLDRHRARCPATERLRAEVAELKRRVRLARAVFAEAKREAVTYDAIITKQGLPYARKLMRRGFDALDLRRPLPRKAKR